MRRMIAIGSGKGGVGKTWLAISLAHALADMGIRTLLVDSDLGLANVDVQLGMARGADLATALEAGEPLSACIRSDTGIGFDVVAGRSGAGRPIAPAHLWSKQLIAELRTLHRDYDVILIDLPSGIGQGVSRLMQAADDKVIVTTGEPTALTDAYSLMKLTRKLETDALPKIVINLAESHRGGRATFDGLTRVCERFLSMQPLALGVIRRDRHVGDAISRQQPLLQCHPQCQAAEDVSTVAKALLAAVRHP